MKKNMGNADKAIRLLVAAIVIALYYAGIVSGTLAIILLILSAIFILTSIVGTCPLYLPLGISTCKVKK
jgi:K+-transporting ATPase A subunit